MKRFLFTAALLLLGLTSALPARAQQQGTTSAPPRRVPATVVLVDSIAQRGAEFVIIRRVGDAPHDLIVLRNGASAAHLSEAVRALLMARQAGGDHATSPATMRVRPHQSRAQRQQQARTVLPWAPRVIADLRRAERKSITGVGVVKAVQIWLPPQNSRRTAQ